MKFYDFVISGSRVYYKWQLFSPALKIRKLYFFAKATGRLIYSGTTCTFEGGDRSPVVQFWASYEIW